MQNYSPIPYVYSIQRDELESGAFADREKKHERATNVMAFIQRFNEVCGCVRWRTFVVCVSHLIASAFIEEIWSHVLSEQEIRYVVSLMNR